MSHLTQVSGLKLLYHIRIVWQSCLTLHRWVDWNSTIILPSVQTTTSHLTQVSGLEFSSGWMVRARKVVSPYTGEWIEIFCKSSYWVLSWVSPYTGEWIEISHHSSKSILLVVSPYIGEWIEIADLYVANSAFRCLTLHRWVDWNHL